MMVSVVIPCYNCEHFLTRAIESVLRQSYPHWELILVNNNSTDQTGLLLAKYNRKFPEKIRMVNQPRPGAPAARNMGLALAMGEWIQFLDADDELMPDKLEANVALVENNDIDVIAGGFFLYRDPGGKRKKEVRFPNTSGLWKALISSELGITSANFWRKRSILAVGGWDESLTSSQEYDLLFRLMVNNAHVYLDKTPRTNLYISNNSVSQSDDPQKQQEILRNMILLRLRIKKHLAEQKLLDIELKRYIDLFLFKHLMKRKHIAPKGIGQMIKQLELRVPYDLRLKMELKHLFKQLSFKNRNTV